MSKDKPMCERCERQTLTTFDIWVQEMTFYKADDGEYEAKSHEVDGRDYIVVCPACWSEIRATIWIALCEATTCDHRPQVIRTYENDAVVEERAIS